jgi:hypothetical protein
VNFLIKFIDGSCRFIILVSLGYFWQYWLQMGVSVALGVACAVLAIIGKGQEADAQAEKEAAELAAAEAAKAAALPEDSEGSAAASAVASAAAETVNRLGQTVVGKMFGSAVDAGKTFSPLLADNASTDSLVNGDDGIRKLNMSETVTSIGIADRNQ